MKPESIRIKWGEHLELPSRNNDGKANPGLAGVFSGYVKDSYIVAGGANFPDIPLSEGGAKTWWADIYVYNGKDWKLYKDVLPQTIGYGYSVELPDGILCIGGCNADCCSDQAYMIKLDKEGSPVVVMLPSMPFPLANMAGGMIDGKVYLAGGIRTSANQEATNTFLCFDLETKTWSELPSWSDKARAFATAAVQNDGETECFYVFSGRDFKGSQLPEILYDGWKFNPKTREWQAVEGYFPVMAGTAMPWEADKILFFGGRCETGDDDNVIRVFNTVSGSMESLPVNEAIIPVTCVLNHKSQEFTIASGETAPGLRTPLLTRGYIEIN
jgi:N-acetylneuraminic acid mutarotase